MTTSLEDIRRNLKSGKIKAVPYDPNRVGQQTPAAARPLNTGEMTASELDALYAKGSQASNSANSHVHGLKAVYEAGQKGLRV